MDKHWQDLFREVLIRDASLQRHNTWGIAGRARMLLVPRSVDEAVALLEVMDEPFFVLGKGSNVLLPDEPVQRPVILFSGQMGGIQMAGPSVRVEAGAGLMQLARRMHQAGLSGLEPLSMIPGTVGGGLLMNAGAHGRSLGDLVVRVRVWQEGSTRWIPASGLTFGYRSSSLMAPDLVVLEAELCLQPDDPERIGQAMAQARQWRRRQPSGRSAGSVFKNPPGDSAGRLIDACGLKGTRIGGAVISPVHGNFILNENNASAADILALIHLCELEVMKVHGVRLAKEVRVIDS